MKILIDAWGGDYAPNEIVKGAIKAAQESRDDTEIALIGDKSLLHVLTGKYLKKLNISIIEAPQRITFNEHPVEAIKNKPDSSIVVGINHLKEGDGDAFISAGNTGAVLCASIFNLGKIKNVERPALANILALDHSTRSILLDVGANSDCRPAHLLQFAQLGNIYAKRLFEIDEPRICLLSNGEEETKGNHLIIESHALLKRSNLNFTGNIDGKDLFRGVADVVVTDGFTGNVVLKTIEAVGDSFIKTYQLGANSYSKNKLSGSALLADIGLGSLTKNIDFREYGGACLLGVKGNVIVSHGCSRAKAIKSAVDLAKRAAKRNMWESLSEQTDDFILQADEC
jgi:glycerol-3-phosphate acyltransferase PlsX